MNLVDQVNFLGRNYLDGLFKREDSKIVQFMKAIQSQENKRFILTSRSSILNQGKLHSELFKINKIGRNEFELNITKHGQNQLFFSYKL